MKMYGVDCGFRSRKADLIGARIAHARALRLPARMACQAYSIRFPGMSLPFWWRMSMVACP